MASRLIRWLALGGALALGPSSAFADKTSKFADCPGAPVYTGLNALPLLATDDARRYRTMIRDGAREKPNFDGHFVVATWGCGSDCQTGAIIDAVSGKVTMLPVVAGTSSDAGDSESRFDYRLDSRLMIMTGMIGEEPPMGAHYFEFDGHRLKRLKTVAVRESQPSAKSP